MKNAHVYVSLVGLTLLGIFLYEGREGARRFRDPEQRLYGDETAMAETKAAPPRPLPAATEGEGRRPAAGSGPTPSLDVAAGSSLTRDALVGLDPGFTPDLETLRALTVDLWDNPEFLQLTEEEARRLFPLDDAIPTWPKSLLQLVHGLPTDADLVAAMGDAGVRYTLNELAATESAILELDLLPARLRSEAWRVIREELAIERAAERVATATALDRAGPFQDWRLLWRLYEEWERSP